MRGRTDHVEASAARGFPSSRRAFHTHNSGAGPRDPMLQGSDRADRARRRCAEIVTRTNACVAAGIKAQTRLGRRHPEWDRQPVTCSSLVSMTAIRSRAGLDCRVCVSTRARRISARLREPSVSAAEKSKRGGCSSSPRAPLSRSPNRSRAFIGSSIE